MDDRLPVTTHQMWLSTLAAACVVGTLGLLAWRRVRPPFPSLLPRSLLALGMAYFTGLYAWAAWTFWDDCYGAVLPSWGRVAAPFVGTAYGALGWVFWSVARRLSPGRAVVPFLALAALQSLPGHLHGIYGRGLLEKCQVVRGISPGSALTFGLVEFATYWAALLLLAHASASWVERRRISGG
jgi:hypothetical protein